MIRIIKDFFFYMDLQKRPAIDRDIIIEKLEVCKSLHGIYYTETMVTFDDLNGSCMYTDLFNKNSIWLKDIVEITEFPKEIQIILRSGYIHELKKFTQFRYHFPFLCCKSTSWAFLKT